MTKRDHKEKLQIPTRKARPKGDMFQNLRKPEEIESLSIEELVAPPQPIIVPQLTIVSETIAPPTIAPETTVVSGNSLPRPETTVVPQTTVDWQTIIEHPEQWTIYPNEISDKVIQLLNVYEQTVLLRLYRLSWGYKSETCRVGLERLAKACNISKKQVQRTIDSLELKGLIDRIGVDLGNSVRKERGSVYRIKLPSAKVERRAMAQQTMASQTIVQQTSNKESIKKESNKRDEAALNIKNCPDCRGSGFNYPNGFEGGVAKCKHEKLAK